MCRTIKPLFNYDPPVTAETDAAPRSREVEIARARERAAQRYR